MMITTDTQDNLLFTPGPLTTSATVKAAMLHDVGSRNSAFIDMVQDIRTQLVDLAGVNTDSHTAIIMQGSGTFSLEAVLSSTVPRDGKLLVIVNGVYGHRIVQIAKMLQIETAMIEVPENQTPDPASVDAALSADAAITHVSVTHCETTTGIINPVAEIGEVVHRHGRCYFVDAMSSFGAVPLDMADAHIDYLVSSANKCIEGVPGFSFVIARIETLAATRGCARSFSFDLHAQYVGLEANGQFRFTPPTHVLRAFHQALQELDAEGGVKGRADRYRANYETLVGGTRELGLTEYLAPDDQGYIITSFRYPEHHNFDFDDFYQRLNTRHFVIYPGKVSDADCFRIGTIGHIFPDDVNDLVTAIAEVLAEMEVDLYTAPTTPIPDPEQR